MDAKRAAILRGSGPRTLFAPTDAAFKKLSDKAVQEIAADPTAVKKLFQVHLVNRSLTAEDLKNLAGQEIRTLGGGVLKIESDKVGLRVGGAKVLASYKCSNGMHPIVDEVLPVRK